MLRLNPSCALLLWTVLSLGCVIVRGGSDADPIVQPGDDGGRPPPMGGPDIGMVASTGRWVPAIGNLAGLPSECGNVGALGVKPDADVLLTGIAQRGLWASRNGGDSWTKLGDMAGSASITNRTSAWVFDPEHPNTFWESGTYNGGAVYKTEDDGATFVALGKITHSDLVSVDFTDPARKTLLAGTHEQSRILYHSTDGGSTWTDIGERLPEGSGHSALPHVIDAQTFLLGTIYSPGAGIYRSTDAGKTWTKVFSGSVRMPPVQSAGGVLYWLLDNNLGVVKSADRGVTWTKVGGGGIIDTYWGQSLIELPDRRLVSLGSDNLVISSDGGATWRRIGPQLPYKPTGVVYSPFRKAFFVWRFTCGASPPVPDDGIMRWAFDYQSG